MLNTDNKTMPILEIQEEKTCSAIEISSSNTFLSHKVLIYT